MREKVKRMIDSLKQQSRMLKREITAIYIACRKPELPWRTKVLGIIIVGYALSPVDLIPDFIPVLGYLDDLILIPAGLALLKRLIPNDMLEECRAEAEEIFAGGKPKNYVAGFLIILVWILVLLYILKLITKLVR